MGDVLPSELWGRPDDKAVDKIAQAVEGLLKLHPGDSTSKQADCQQACGLVGHGVCVGCVGCVGCASSKQQTDRANQLVQQLRRVVIDHEQRARQTLYWLDQYKQLCDSQQEMIHFYQNQSVRMVRHVQPVRHVQTVHPVQHVQPVQTARAVQTFQHYQNQPNQPNQPNQMRVQYGPANMASMTSLTSINPI